MTTTQLPLSDDLNIQDSATADELNFQRLQVADQSLALEDLFICLITYLHKGPLRLYDRRHKECLLIIPLCPASLKDITNHH